MDPLMLGSPGPATMQALSALRSVRMDGTADSSLLASQDLAQGLSQQGLPAFTLTPAIPPAAGLGLSPVGTDSLLAALTAPQPAANATPTLDATTQPTTALQAPSTTPAPVADTNSPAPATEDPLATSTSLDFALQAALRFGAGVVGSAPPSPATAGAGPVLVRDASSVMRNGGLQDHTGAPGPEAFLLPKDTLDRAHKSYQVNTTPPNAGVLDLLA